MKKQVGLLTGYKDYYGSILQCYATKRYIESLGIDCEVIFRRKKKLANAPRHILKAVKHQGYIHNYVLVSKEVKGAPLKIPSDATEKMNRFVSDVLSPKGYTWRQLQQVSHSPNYMAFIAGSDQIWNTSTLPEPAFFLTFAESTKRIALSASFGIPYVPDYNTKAVRKFLSGFERISVREESGVQIVKRLTQVPVVRLADPVLFFKASDWHSFGRPAEVPEEPYVFAHFIDAPSECAIKATIKFAEKMNCRILCFTYPHESLENYSGSFHVNGSPVDYVGLIDHAAAVFTDSFHTTMFSIVLNKKFFTFPRQYQHDNLQSCRITDLLQRYDLQSHYISGEPQLPQADVIPWEKVNAMLEKESRDLKSWLIAELNRRLPEAERIPL